MYEELAEKKAEKNKDDKKEVVKKEPPSVYNERGEIRMMNQGKYEFSLFDDVEKERIRFELKVPKYLDTSDMEVDLNPLYVRIRVRDKYTQIRFSHEIIVEKSTVQRSQANGALVIVCPKLDPDPREREVEIGRKKRLQEAKSILEEEKKRKEEEEEQAEKKKRQEEYSEYLKEEREKKEKQKKKKEEELVEDDSDIPPLE